MTETHDLVTRLLAAIERAEQEGAKRSCGAVHPQFDTYHPAGHPDPAVQRCCAADRKILDLHAPVRVPPTWATVGLTRHMETTGGVDCKTCCDDSDGTSYAQRSGLEWPCPTIQALAERYDLAEQQGDQL